MVQEGNFGNLKNWYGAGLNWYGAGGICQNENI